MIVGARLGVVGDSPAEAVRRLRSGKSLCEYEGANDKVIPLGRFTGGIKHGRDAGPDVGGSGLPLIL